jgi:hypothetical protein
LCGDIGNAFITADCLEKVYAVASPEFGDREDSIAILIKALYGLRSTMPSELILPISYVNWDFS